MRPMNHPDYVRQPWSEERRLRASAAAKARHRALNSSPAKEMTFKQKFARGSIDGQHDLLQAFLNLIRLYRGRPGDREFQRMLADCLEDMAQHIAADLRK